MLSSLVKIAKNLFITKMTGKANEILQNTLDSCTQDYEEIKNVLLQRFHENKSTYFFQKDSNGSERRPGESLLDYASKPSLRRDSPKVKMKLQTTPDYRY